MTLSRRHDLPFYVHVLETKLAARFSARSAWTDARSFAAWRDAGFLSERLNIIHGVWLDEHDMDLIAEGVGRDRAQSDCNLRAGQRGHAVPGVAAPGGFLSALGSDEALRTIPSTCGPWQSLRLDSTTSRTVDYQQWPKSNRDSRLPAAGLARRAMRSPVPIGQIAAGHQADLIMVDLDTLAFTPLNDLHRQARLLRIGGARSV